MGASDLTLYPGDILRGVVDRVDESADACILNVGSHGLLAVDLAGMSGDMLARLVPGACVCAQVLVQQRGRKLARASFNIEFSGRTSVMILDGTQVASGSGGAAVEVFVSDMVPSLERADLAKRMRVALDDASTGLPSMIGVVGGKVQIILRNAAAETPWDKVLSAIVVQMTEAAAFSVVAQVDVAPALIMAEKPDVDGDSLLLAGARRFDSPSRMLNGHRLTLGCGAVLVFERTESLWSVTVDPSGKKPGPGMDQEAAKAAGESFDEYGVEGLVGISYAQASDKEELEELANLTIEEVGGGSRCISVDSAHSFVLLSLCR